MPVPRRFDRRPPERDTTRINERIRVPKVRLIGAEGEQLGIVDIDEALKRAQDADLDLVEVAPGSKPPVTRLLDYSKYKYEQEQKQKQARKHQQQVNIREIKLRPKIAQHDYETKMGHVARFLRHQDKVKVTIMFRGREQAHPERGRALLQRLYEDLDGLAVIESQPLQEGRNMSMLLAPGKEAVKVDDEASAERRGDSSHDRDTGRRGDCRDEETPTTEDAPAAEAEETPLSRRRLLLRRRLLPRRRLLLRTSPPMRTPPRMRPATTQQRLSSLRAHYYVGDPLCGLAVPERRRFRSLRWALGQQRRDLSDRGRVEAQQGVGAGGDRDRALGVVAQGEAGDAEVGRLLLDAAGVG